MVEEQTDRFKLAMANANMPHMDCLLQVLLEKNIPVILMSSERSISAAIKAIAEGASFFLHKPISLDDLKYIWQHAYRKKRSFIDPSINAPFQGTSHDQNAPINDTKCKGKDKQIEVFMTPDCSSQNHGGSEMKRPNVDKQGYKEGKRLKIIGEGYSKIEEEEENKQTMNSSLEKRPRILWTPDLHLKFTGAISALGDRKARPKPILEIMNVPHLTPRQVASHLQKYKSQVQRICETGTTNLPALSRSSNFYGRTTNFDTLVKQTISPICDQGRPYSDFGITGDMLQILKAPSGNFTSDITSFYSSQNKNQVLGTSGGTTQELDSLAGQFSSGNYEPNAVKFPTDSMDRNQKLDFMQVSKTTPAIGPNADKFPADFNINDWDEEFDVVAILNLISGEMPDIENILTASSDWNPEQDVMEVSHPTTRNMSEADTSHGKQKRDATSVSGSAPPGCSIYQSQPLLDLADLLNILEEEPAGFNGLASDYEPNPGDIDRYCEWLTNVMLGKADDNRDAADFNYGSAQKTNI
ncbi:hypothetical protein GH714_041131 [Hevea brasiliensis]|uniref:Uncharacterized protein n=1 Tax=Hevea brasiliensis TaxID=3981 RepID=A0A6A6MZU7_HEVBR|nr:hypothetical protein GH714_041131 [Hevea brasiliensis]